MKKAVIIACLLVGVNSILAQVILIRELLVNFSGNELTMGIIIATWLTGGAVGSLILARIFIDKVKNPAEIFAIILSSISVITPIIVFLSRSARAVFHIPIYEVIGPGQIILISCLFIAPLSCLLSICFVLCCKVFKEILPDKNIAGTVYILEAIGATLAGALFSFWLVRHFDSFKIVLLAAVINILYISWLSIISKKGSSIALILLAVSIFSVASNLSDTMNKKSQTLQWKPQRVLAYKNSHYGNITVTDTGRGINFYENGSLFFTTEDEASNEELINLIMLQHEKSDRVLLLGGGIGGVLRQILKHNPKRLTYIELDPLTIDVAKDFISSQDRAALSDPRIEIIHEDARFFINRTKEKFDIITVNLPDPTTLQLNRFYTKEFYKRVLSCLNEGGILACRVVSKESIVSDEMAKYNSSVYKTLKSVFSYVGFIPGENLIFVASNDPKILEGRPDILIKRFDARKIETEFLTSFHIKDRYYPHSLAYFEETLARHYSAAKTNTDFYPVSLYYGLILWNILFNPSLVKFFSLIEAFHLPILLFLIIKFVIVCLFIIKFARNYMRYIVISAIAVTGALNITFEIILLLSFQIIYGYVYEKVGFLIALFMLGLASGGYIMNKAISKFGNYERLFSYVILIYSLYILLVPFITKKACSIPVEATQFIFYIMILLAGVLGGSQFPVAVAILQKQKSTVHSASLIWGADLLGAGVGVLISSLIIIPLLGIPKTAILGFIWGGIIFLLLILARRRLQQ